jgi:endonuclease/exonuclease/phosphatase family metal-dependent hydrolase
VLWRVGPGLDPAPATTVAYDFVQILVDALRARGMRYDVACVYEGFDAEFPGFTPTGIQDIRLSDREVILVRRDGEVDVSSAQTGQFANNLMLPTPMGPFNLKRGWASVDAEVAGRMFRFVTSHLDADVPAIRLLQAGELLAGPCATSMPLVLVGDVNSDANGGPTSAAYAALQAGGFDDAWTETQGGSLGFTWGHDEMLVSPVPFTAPGGPVRIDVVLFRGDVEAHDAERHGHLTSDRFQGLWPSDHVGVSAELRIRR